MADHRSYQELARERNLSLILKALHAESPTTRPDLARKTGINRTTVSSLVEELVDYDLVREVGYDSSGLGRRSLLLELNPSMGYVVAAEQGADFVSVICSDFTPRILWECQETISDSLTEAEILGLVVDLCRQGLAHGSRAGGRACGLSLGVHGLVEPESGLLRFAPNLGWTNVPLGEVLGQTFDLPLFIDNEANLAVLGEHIYGAARGYSEILYVDATRIGLGAAMMTGGQLFRGANGAAGELGHFIMDPGGELCRCGTRGCWETQVSQAATFRYLSQAMEDGLPSMLSGAREVSGSNWSSAGLTFSVLVTAANQGDEAALAALNRLGSHLANGIGSFMLALSPELVILGGHLCEASEYLLPPICQELGRRAARWSLEAPKAVLAQHDSHACTIGGVAVVYQAILSEPISFLSNLRTVPLERYAAN
jgi:predicted NBD/HSP70 family sugar kinase